MSALLELKAVHLNGRGHPRVLAGSGSRLPATKVPVGYTNSLATLSHVTADAYLCVIDDPSIQASVGLATGLYEASLTR